MFNNYTHFKNYCLKIARNKDFNIEEHHLNIFDNFECIFDILHELEYKKIISTKYNILDVISNKFRYYKFESAFILMNESYKSLDAQKNLDKINYSSILNFVNRKFDLDILYDEDFLLNPDSQSSIYYPNLFSTLLIKEKEEKIYPLDNIDMSFKNKFGVYFIYDENEELVYIGKSTNCFLTRAFQSIKERNVLSFSKIELRECKSKSDVAIYESYYIGLYKPKYNNDLVFNDLVSITLPDLQVTKTIKRNLSKSISHKYKYYSYELMNIKYFNSLLDKGEKIYINNPENIKILNDLEIYDDYTMKQKIYEKLANDKNDLYLNEYCDINIKRD